jgi:Icc-related predicted phosphoesterase
VDIFICHAPIYKLTDADDYAHTGSEAILKYIQEKQPKLVYHGHVHSKMGTMVDNTAIVSVYGAEVFTLD